MSERTRSRRQPALRMFAREYYEASLVEQGSGQYDPSFVITKLGARVNRMCVAGLLERMERRETEYGTMYHGSLRDPTGLHMFSVGSFQPELHADMEELLSRHEENEPLLLLAVGKANAQMTDDGGVFTRVRLEEFTIIDGEAYANWLVDAADATLRRIDTFQRSRDLPQDADAYRTADIPPDLADSLLLAGAHYGEIDPDVYMVGVLRALDRAEGNISEFGDDAVGDSSGSLDEFTVDAESGDASEGMSVEDISKIIEKHTLSADVGDGVAYDDLIGHCATHHISRGEAEPVLDSLVDDARLYEHTFGRFKHIEAK